MYQSLYRKYRPSNFEEVYGQDVAKKILINSIKQNKISHAYLLYGPRGTGKTSIAKMFARICNCLNNENGKCCNTCPNCIESNDKNCVDIIEIDAASNNGVDEIRELKNKINLVPNKLKYKVYIIDEVHMLSTGAFNALLKTLEEPPEHIIFILATTEFYKVPTTIVSRCQTIEFKNIDDQSMYNRLNEISKTENILIDDSGISEIIKNSNGGLRDAIGLLEKLSLYCDDKTYINADNVKEIVGSVSSDEIKKLLDNILNKNLDKSFEQVKKYFDTGKDLIKILNELIYELRNQIVEDYDYDKLTIINLMNEYSIKLKKSGSTKIMFEMMIIELLNKKQKNNTKTNVRQLLSDEDKHSSNMISKESLLDENEYKVRVNNTFCNANKKFLIDIKQKWNLLDNYTFDAKNGSMVCDLIDCCPVVASDTNLILTSNYETMTSKINSKLKKYELVLKEKLNIDLKIVVVTDSQWKTLKEEYMNNIKNGYKYSYITDENSSKKEKTQNNIHEKAKELFGDLLKKEDI